MTRTIRVTDTEHLLPLVPHLVGLDPADSVVLIAFGARRSLGALRITRPAHSSDPAAVAQHLIGMLCNITAAETVLPLLYTPHTTGDARADRALLTALTDAGHAAGFVIPDAILIAADGWTTTEHTRPRPIPDCADRSLPPLLDTDRESRLADPDPALIDRLSTQRVDATRIAAAAFRGFDPTDAIEAALTGDAPVALLLSAAALPALRDVVLLHAGWGADLGRQAWRGNVLGEDLTDASPAARAYGGDWTRPDAARLQRLASALHLAAAAADDPDTRAGIAAMLAWTNWALGRSSIATRLAAAALALNPDLGLAALIADHVSRGRLPEWAWNPDPVAGW